MQEKLKDTPVGTDGDGRSNFINILRSSFEGIKISEDTLLGYDKNIQFYVNKINHRREPVSLKYFQYLSILWTEIVLDNLKNRKAEFVHELNEFLKIYKEKREIEIIDEFTESDLKKLAFWMATGSGKTLITHINYYQFFRYKLFSPDNIILITPNEGLSKQHFEELQKSGIPCRLYGGNISSLNTITGEQEVLVLEMTKLVEEKRGGGVTLPVDVFEGRNLVFVDEGHKGKRSEEQKWARLRDRITEDGFVFEYSATFGQILSENNEETLKEYAKSIIFDYSYKYFYLDGYGKDFSVLNVKQTRISERKFQETMFIANLLSFYEQILVYEENKNLAKEYNLEKPLWIFVGITVIGKEEESDVIQIVEFLNRVMQNTDWVKEKSEDILNRESGLKNEQDEDIFSSKFEYLKSKNFEIDDIYKKVFGGKGNFCVHELKNAEGELGLKVGENDYFGVINIGDVSGFKKELEKKGITVSQDVVSVSLFDAIKKEISLINILIGSKKFIEGWDTWRVSSMGLLNIGKGQGPQIIQLFGRGIRLKGKGFSLKRSEHPVPAGYPSERGEFIQFLEMLNIYGIKTDYLTKFLEAIRKEEVELETIEITVEPQHKEKWGMLWTLTRNENKRFEEDNVLPLKIDEQIHSIIDLLPKVSLYLSQKREEGGIKGEEIKPQMRGMSLPDGVIELFDWGRILKEVYEFKTIKGYWNLVSSERMFKDFLLSGRYEIQALPEVLTVKNKDDINRIEDIAILVIKKYMDSFYGKYAKRFETDNLQYDYVGRQKVFSIFDKKQDKYSYTVQIDKTEKKLINDIRKLAKNLNELLKDDEETLPRIYFDRHLYVPLLLQTDKIKKITPSGLVKSEKDFLKDLKQYLRNNKKRFSDIEIYLLRNFPKSGIGFSLQWHSFYPDFIMWIKEKDRQGIIFIDPKGLEHTKVLDDEKIMFAKNGVRELEQKLRVRNSNIYLGSFMLSATPYRKLKEGRENPLSEDEYINHHVLFLDDKNWPEKLFKNYL